jgi:E3 ubiquitin-protein ligase BAH
MLTRIRNDEIVGLRDEVTKLSRPHRFSKSDLNRWREIFELYVQAQVFFSTRELDRCHSARSSEAARERLVWFQTQVSSTGVLERFKLRTSMATYSRFLSLNARLLHALCFQELNRTAVAKIIKSKRAESNRRRGEFHAG